MRSGSRLSERWFTLALWLVALVFAWFLIGLGSLVVGDLPQVETRYTLDQFLDTALLSFLAEPRDERFRDIGDRLAIRIGEARSLYQGGDRLCLGLAIGGGNRASQSSGLGYTRGELGEWRRARFSHRN